MGCSNAFHYKRNEFDNICYYIEKVDKRLGDIYQIKTSLYQSDYIAKEIDLKLISSISERNNRFKKAFQNFPNFVLQIRDFSK